MMPLTVAATCGPIPEPLPAKDGAARMDPLPIYAAYWYEMEECSGRRGSFRAVTWYVVASPGPGKGVECSQTGGCEGIYFHETHAIYIREWATGKARIVKHEILHALGLQHKDPDLWRCLRQEMPERFKQKRRGRP